MSKDDFATSSQGISQSERLLNTLIPEFVEIDPRQMPDLIRFSAQFSSQINYYNLSDKLDGTWDDFFIRDPYLLLLLVSRFNITGNINTFSLCLNALQSETGKDAKMARIKEMFSFLSNLGSQLSLLNRQFLQINEPKQIEEVLMNVSDAEEELQDLHLFYDEASEEFGHLFEYGLQLPAVSAHKPPGETGRFFFKGGSEKERMSHSMTVLVELFNRLNAKFNRLVEASQRHIAHHPLSDQQFSPQTGLYISFLELYTTLGKKINGINRRHLDFYFKDLLAIPLNEGSPDRVHLIIEPDQSRKNLQITTTNLFLAQIPGKEQPVSYRLETDLLVTHTQIAEVKTVLMSHFVQIASNKPELDDLVETQVYHASQPVFVPAIYQKNSDSFPSWAALGEDQHELAGNMRTMEDADLGLIIGSPLFYLPEGERVIRLKIHLKPDGFNSLVHYVTNFSSLTGKKTETSIHDLFSNAFTITYTSAEGWSPAKNYSVTFDTENSKDKILEVTIRLYMTDPGVEPYNHEIHELLFDSAFPLIRLGLNNYAEHHPYSFFRNIHIERLTINSDVKGLKLLRLQNNIGVVSTANPFQIFGPQPTLGSFLDIKNTNVFNCFTKDFSIHLEWLDLPREKGGLTTYYKGYGVPFSNTSFKVGISSMNKGVFLPESDDQQRITLFSMQTEREYLKNRTDITTINFSKIEFQNRPALASEFNGDQAFRDGAVRLELCSPPEAFGHRLFPQIFPEVVMKNARRFGKKESLPNQPLIPVIKSISVDYALECSENFNEGSATFTSNVELFHCYPFGHERVYPGNDKKNVLFIPRFEDDGNLLIGLKNAVAGSEISLLFQLEENCFHHTLHEADDIKWTYLENNNWVSLRNKEVLSDTTNNFITSGIVKIRLPWELTKGNTIVNPELFWIRASSNNMKGQHPSIKGICINGATAVRVSNPLSEDESDHCLPPGSIKGFLHTLKGVEQIWQLFPSFHGKPPEGSDKYYVRISERLRHKQRPVQSRDIIQVILEEFPQILMVKCFNTSVESFMVVPGINLQLVLIPREGENRGFMKEEPKVSLATLYQVKTFLMGIVSPFASIEVGNPVYEKVKVICKVLFTDKASVNQGGYLRKLYNDINRYIAPWLFGEKEDLKIGHRIYKTDILIFIKTRPYVEYVSAFSAVHFYNSKTIPDNELNAEITDTALDHGDYIVSSSPSSVLIPSSNHLITLLEEPEFEPARPSGIGDFILGDELLVSDPVEKKKVPQAAPLQNEGEDELFSLIITHNI